MRVLLIEDDKALAQTIELMLISEGLSSDTVETGEEGLDFVKIYEYDILLLDLGLPDMSGYDVLRKLRNSKNKTPILILSGMDGIEDKVKGLGFGADDYMTKPFHKDELIARINAVVRHVTLDVEGQTLAEVIKVLPSLDAIQQSRHLLRFMPHLIV
jgi:two-component system cell cycle response regulator CtrA